MRLAVEGAFDAAGFTLYSATCASVAYGCADRCVEVVGRISGGTGVPFPKVPIYPTLAEGKHTRSEQINGSVAMGIGGHLGRYEEDCLRYECVT